MKLVYIVAAALFCKFFYYMFTNIVSSCAFDDQLGYIVCTFNIQFVFVTNPVRYVSHLPDASI